MFKPIEEESLSSSQNNIIVERSKGSTTRFTVNTFTVAVSLLQKAVTDLCLEMTVGVSMGDTFIWIITEATCCSSTEQSDGFEEECGGEVLGICSNERRYWRETNVTV